MTKKFNFRENRMREIARKRMEKKAIIKREWSDSGAADSALDQLHGRYEADRPTPDSLPF